MTIGILTYHWVYNFGANLQTLATINYVKSQGHIPIVINYKPIATESWYKKIVPESEIEAFKDFSRQFYELTERCENEEEVRHQIRKYKIDGVIIGSDSLFNIIRPYFQWQRIRIIKPSPDHVFPNPFWGNIGCKHSGLSISSQNANYKRFKKRRTEIGQSLKEFKYISVRDNWTKDLVTYFTNGVITPNICPDPVFSFNTYGRNLIIPKEDLIARFNLNKEYVLYNPGNGVFSNNWIDSFNSILENNGCQLVQLPHTLSRNVGTITWPLSPLEWYSLIVHSKGYVGILMHPIIVCLHNNIPFFSIDHYGLPKEPFRSSKIYHIVKKAGFIDNYCNLVANMPIPSPEYVYTLLSKFDKEKCGQFAREQENECLNNLSIVLNSLL